MRNARNVPNENSVTTISGRSSIPPSPRRPDISNHNRVGYDQDVPSAAVNSGLIDVPAIKLFAEKERKSFFCGLEKEKH